MNGNSLGVVLSPEVLAAAERSEGSPGEPQRSGVAAKTGVDLLLASRPDPEVVAKPKRRSYTAQYKLSILEALTPQTRGPKSKRHPLDEENQKLRRQNARLAEDLRKAHIIIDVQKKVAALLGHPIPEQDPEEES